MRAFAEHFDLPDEVLEIYIQSGPITFTQSFQLLDIIAADRTAWVGIGPVLYSLRAIGVEEGEKRMKHLLSTLDTFSFRRHEGFTKQDGNTGFCSSEELETGKRNSRCWRTKIFRMVSAETPNVGRMGICFLLLSNVQRFDHTCLNLNAVRDCFSTLDMFRHFTWSYHINPCLLLFVKHLIHETNDALRAW